MTQNTISWSGHHPYCNPHYSHFCPCLKPELYASTDTKTRDLVVSWGDIAPITPLNYERTADTEAPLSYTLNDDEAAVALVVAKRRNTLNRGGTNLPGGETASNDERLKQHYVACMSEIAMSRLLNLCWSGCGKGASGLVDVGGVWQVRSITESHKGLLVRAKDEGDEPTILVLVDPETRLCTALGWATADFVRGQGRVIDAHSNKPAWVLAASKLHTLRKAL